MRAALARMRPHCFGRRRLLLQGPRPRIPRRPAGSFTATHHVGDGRDRFRPGFRMPIGDVSDEHLPRACPGTRRSRPTHPPPAGVRNPLRSGGPMKPAPGCACQVELAKDVGSGERFCEKAGNAFRAAGSSAPEDAEQRRAAQSQEEASFVRQRAVAHDTRLQRRGRRPGPSFGPAAPAPTPRRPSRFGSRSGRPAQANEWLRSVRPGSPRP